MAGGNAFYTASHALPYNSFYCLGHFKNVYDDDDDECFSAGTVRETVYRRRPGLPGRRTHHLEQPAGQRDICPVSVNLPSASENISVPDFVP